MQASKLRPEQADRLDRFPRLQPVIAHINASLSGDLSRASLAKLINLSPSRFSAVFQEIMTMPPKTYVRERRLKRGAELLAESDTSIGDIAERVGYCDQFEFSHRFKKRWGLSPRAYRQAVRRFDGGLGQSE